MSPDDPRHGTYAGAVAHYMDKSATCDPCKDAAATYRRNRRTRLYLARSTTLLVPALGTKRRLQALVAIGYSMEALSRDLDCGSNWVHAFLSRDLDRVQQDTATKVSALFERLCMDVPQGPYANRTRILAARKGWVKPLAWDNLDDPNEQPVGWEYRAPNRAEIVADLDERGASISEVCRVLKISHNALERWCTRQGKWDVFKRLRAREPIVQEYRNQWTRESA